MGMRVLFIVPYTPNLIRVRSYQLIRSLARRGHQVTLATLWTSEGERAGLDRLAAEGIRVLACPLSMWRSLWNCLRALPTAWSVDRGAWSGTLATPMQAAYCWHPALARIIDFEIRNSKSEIAHVEHLRGARYGLYVKSEIPNPKSQIRTLMSSKVRRSTPATT
jgi:hypothetical protein